MITFKMEITGDATYLEGRCVVWAENQPVTIMEKGEVKKNIIERLFNASFDKKLNREINRINSILLKRRNQWLGTK